MKQHPRAFCRALMACLCLMLVALFLLLSSSPALARQVFDLDEQKQPVALRDWGDWWLDDAGLASIGKVSELPAAWLKPTQGSQFFELKPRQALWIRFSLPAAPDEQRWYVKLPSPGLDRVDLYTRNSQGSWTVQRAGDLLPVADWPLPHLYPVFPLIVSAENPTYYALRIEASHRFSTPIVFENESRLSTSQQNLSLLHGVYFGFLVMVSLFALSTAITMRDASHAFFGLWAAALTLSVASVVGVGGVHLWPQAAAWNDASNYVLPVLSLAPLLIFVAQAVSLKVRKTWLHWTFVLLALATLGMAASLVMLPAPLRIHLTYASCAACALVCVATTGWAFSMGDRFAGWLLLGFAPLLLLLGAPLLNLAAEQAAWLPNPLWLPLAGQAAVGLALPAMLLMLMLRNQERRDFQRRISQIDRVDPATGLVNDLVFMHRLRGQIERSARLKHLSMVVVIDITNRSKMLEEFGRRTTLEVALRLAQRLSTFVRDVDTVARLGDARFGLLIEGPVAPERVTNMATKIMARCVMPFGGLPASLNVRPKIAIAMVPIHANTAEEALMKLDVMLMEAAPDYKKNIFMLNTAAVDTDF